MPAQHNSHQHQSHNQCITMQCAPGRSSSQRQHPGADQPGDVTPNCCTRACKGPALTAHGGIGNTAAQRSHHGPGWGHLVALVILVATSNLSCIDAQSWLSMSSSSSSSSLLSGNPTEPLHMRRSSLSTHPYHTTSQLAQEQVELEATIADDISPAILIAILASSLLLILIILMVIHRFRVLSAPSAGKHHDSKADDSLRDEHIVDERPKASASIVRRESTKAERSQENRHSGIGLAKRHGSLPFSTRPSVAMMRSFDTPSTSFSSYLHLKSTDSGGDVGDDPAAIMMSESILASSLDMARTPHTLLGTAYSSLPMSSDQHILGDHHQHHWSAAAYSSARRHDNHRRQHNDYVLQQPRAASSRLMSSMTSYPSLQVTSSLGSEASHCLDDEEDERSTRRDDEVGSRTSKSSQNILQLVTFPPCSSDDDDDDIIDGDENDQAPTPPGAILRSRVSSASFSLATHHNSTRSLHGEIHRTRSGREHLHGSHNPVLFRRADSCQSLVDRTVSGESQRSANNNNSGGGGGGGMRMSTSRSHTASFTCIVQARQDSEHDASGSGGVRLTRNRSSAAAQQDESHDRSADHAVMHACQPEQRVASPTADPACRTDSLMMSSPMEMTSQSARNASASNTVTSSRTNTSSSSHSERIHSMAPKQSSTLMQSQPSHPHSEAGHRHHYHGDRGQGHSILTAPVHARQVFVSERQGIFRRTSSYHRNDTAPQQQEPLQHDQTQRVPQGRVQIPQQQLAVSVLPSLVPTLPRHSTLQYQRTGENIVLHGKPSKSSSMPSLQDLTDAPFQPGTLQSLAHTLHDTGDARHHHQDHNGVLKYPPSRHGGAKSQWVPHLGTPSDSVDHTRIATGAADNKERRAGAMEAERQGYCNSSSADATPVLSPISDPAAASAAAAVATAAEQHRMLRQAASLPVGGVYTSDEGATSTDSTTPSSSATSSDSEVVSPSAPLQMPTIDMLYGWHPTQPSQHLQQQVQAPMNQPGEGAHRRPVDADPHYVYEQYPLSSLDLLPMDAVQTVPAANQPVHGQAEPIPVPSTDDVGTPHMLYRSTSPRPGAMKRRKLSETQDTVAPEHGANPEQPPDVEQKRHSRGSWNFKHQLHQSVDTGLSTAEIYRRASTEYSGSRGSQYYLGARSAGVSTASKHWHLDRLTAPPTVDKSTAAAAAAAHEHQWSVAHRGEITEDTVSFGVASMQENDLTPAASFGSQLNRAAATAVSDTRHYHNFGSMHVPLSSRSHHESNKELPSGYASGMPRPQLHEDHAIPLPLTRKNVVASSSAQRASNTSSGGGGGGGGGGGSAIQKLYAGRYPPLEVDGKKTSRQVSSTSIASQSDSSGTAATSSTLTPDTGFYGYECDVQL